MANERDLADDGHSPLADSIVRPLRGVCGSETGRVSSPINLLPSPVKQTVSVQLTQPVNASEASYTNRPTWTPTPGLTRGTCPARAWRMCRSSLPTWQPAKLCQ